MFLNFLAKNSFLSNPVDVIFFTLIAVALAVIIILFVASKLYQNHRDKKYEELERLAKEQELVGAQELEETSVEEESLETQTEEVPTEETPVEEETVEETPVEEVKEEKVEEVPVEEVKEEKVEEVPVEEVKEEKPATKKTTTKKTPAKKTTTKKATTKAEEKVEEAPVEEVKEEKPATKKTTTKKTPANKTTTKKVATKAEEKVEEKPVEEVKEEKPTTKKTTTKKATTPKVEETTEQKGRVYSGKYEVYPSGDGYQYRLKASNGELLVVSEVYTTKDSTLKAIEAVKRNVETGEIRIFKDKKGLFKFKLTSKNYRVIALGSSYATEKRATSASESFKKFALNSNVVEIETPANQDNIVEALVDTSSAEEKNGGKYLVEKFDGEYSWDLKASNGQILCQAEGYTSKTGVMSSIESFKHNVETGTFKILKDKNEHYHYNLYTASGRLANIGETYNSKQLAESAALSVVSFFKNAEIEEKK